MKVKYNQKTGNWDKLEPHSEEGILISQLLFDKLMNINKIRKKGWDCIFLIDGDRRSGKSTLGLTCAKILQPDMTIDNVAAGTQDAIDKIEKLPDGSVLLIDEGSLVFNSKEALKKEQIKILKIIDVVGVKRLVLIVILPSFFELSRPIAVTHSRFLLHVYTDAELNRGKCAYFSKRKKAKLYQFGKKNFGSYDFPESDFVFEFGNYNPLGQEYHDLKKRSFIEALHSDDVKPPKVKELSLRAKQHIDQRDYLMYYIYKNKIMNQREIAEYLKGCNAELTDDAISIAVKKFRNSKIDFSNQYTI